MNRAWVFVIGKPLSDAELEQLELAGNTFVQHWTAHDHQLHGKFAIYKKRIIVVTVNESLQGASGCSIDKLTRFIRLSEARFDTELLNRTNIAYKSGDNVEVIRQADVPELIGKGTLSENSLIYNTSAGNEDELSRWEIPLKESWLSRYLQKA
jgi:hypothetical protein